MLDLDIEEKMPRLTNHQTKRANHAVDSIEDYYRVSVYIPLVENILSIFLTFHILLLANIGLKYIFVD